MGKNSKSQEAEIIMKTPTWNQQAHLPPGGSAKRLLGFLLTFFLGATGPPPSHCCDCEKNSICSLGRCAQGAFHWLAQSVSILFFPLLESQAIGETSVFFFCGFMWTDISILGNNGERAHSFTLPCFVPCNRISKFYSFLILFFFSLLRRFGWSMEKKEQVMWKR